MFLFDNNKKNREFWLQLFEALHAKKTCNTIKKNLNVYNIEVLFSNNNDLNDDGIDLLVGLYFLKSATNIFEKNMLISHSQIINESKLMCIAKVWDKMCIDVKNNNKLKLLDKYMK